MPTLINSTLISLDKYFGLRPLCLCEACLSLLLCLQNLGVSSVDRISSINNHSRSLHKARLIASKEENAICHLLRSAHPAHGCNRDSWFKHLCIRLRHWCINNTWADAVDTDEVFGVLYLRVVSHSCHRHGRFLGRRPYLTSMASHLVRLITAALEPQYAAV